MGSVSQIGWEWYSRLARRLTVTLVDACSESRRDHRRRRTAQRFRGYLHRHGVVCRTVYRPAKWLFPKSEHCVFMISLIDFFVYDNVALRLLKRRAGLANVSMSYMQSLPLPRLQQRGFIGLALRW